MRPTLTDTTCGTSAGSVIDMPDFTSSGRRREAGAPCSLWKSGLMVYHLSIPPVLTRRPPMERASNRLRAELATFLVLTFALSSIFYVLFAHAKTLSLGGGLYVGLLMWCPGVSALITR